MLLHTRYLSSQETASLSDLVVAGQTKGWNVREAPKRNEHEPWIHDGVQNFAPLLPALHDWTGICPVVLFPSVTLQLSA